MYDITAAPIVRFVREASALSQRELAERAGTTQAVVSRIESGDASPSVEMVQRLAGAAGYEIRLECVPRRVTDPVVEAYKPGVDKTLLVEQLKKSSEQRVETMLSMQRLTGEFRRAGREARGQVAERPPAYGGEGKDALRALQEAGVDLIIIGGLAATLHGSARVTFDIDVLYSRTDENIARLVAALRPLSPYLRGAPPGLPFQFDEPTVKAGLNFTLTTSAGSFDLLGEVTGCGRYEDVAAHSRGQSVFGHDSLVIDLDWLIRAKRAAGRPKDLEVLAELEILRDLTDANN